MAHQPRAGPRYVAAAGGAGGGGAAGVHIGARYDGCGAVLLRRRAAGGGCGRRASDGGIAERAGGGARHGRRRGSSCGAPTMAGMHSDTACARRCHRACRWGQREGTGAHGAALAQDSMEHAGMLAVGRMGARRVLRAVSQLVVELAPLPAAAAADEQGDGWIAHAVVANITTLAMCFVCAALARAALRRTLASSLSTLGAEATAVKREPLVAAVAAP